MSSVNPIPVELTFFNARVDGQRIELHWETASETNNAVFRVEHSKSDEESWRVIDSVQGQGTTSSPSSYRVELSNLDPGSHRFRLEQVDVDGTTNVSRVARARLPLKRPVRLTAPVPHPVHSETTLQFGVRKSERTTIRLYNVLGEEVKTLYQGTPRAGETQSLRLDGTALPSGTYFVRLQAGSHVRSRRIVVVR